MDCLFASIPPPSASDTCCYSLIVSGRGKVTSPVAPEHPPVVRFGLANGSVALAAVGELAVPALLPASAILLVASNVKVIRLAWHELSRRQIGLPVLFSTIILGTLLSGQFLAAC